MHWKRKSDSLLVQSNNKGSGAQVPQLKFFRLDTWDEIYVRSVSANFADQLQEIRCVFRIRDCTFPVPGNYEAALFGNKEMIAHRRFRIGHKETSG
jgi:hypothetical protein